MLSPPSINEFGSRMLAMANRSGMDSAQSGNVTTQFPVPEVTGITILAFAGRISRQAATIARVGSKVLA